VCSSDLAATPRFWNDDEPDTLALGRVLAPSVRVYDSPALNSRHTATYYFDNLIPLYGRALGNKQPAHNSVWYLTREGYVYSSWIQWVAPRVNALVRDVPEGGFLGEVTDAEKNSLIGGALAFLHPVDWPEPFGLSMLEAFACGTPVIARRRGSIPEVVDQGRTGFVFEEDDEAVRHILDDCPSFSREGCRKRFEERFLSARMAADYLSVYEGVVSKRVGANA